MKTILLLTDFSKSSINAMQYAVNLYGKTETLFYLLHVKSTASYTTDDLLMPGNQSIYNTLIEPAKKDLAQLVIDLKTEFPNYNLDIKILVEFKTLTSAAQHLVDSKNIDLIVMGSNGASNAKEIIFGSNTINTIRKVQCATLVIPEGFSYRKPNTILVPLENDTELNHHAFYDGVLKFYNAYSMAMHVLRLQPHDITTNHKAFDMEYLEGIKRNNPHLNYVYQVVKNIPVYHTVSTYVQTHPIDVVALMIQKERFFDRFLNTSSTDRISNNLLVPLLLFHTDE